MDNSNTLTPAQMAAMANPAPAASSTPASPAGNGTPGAAAAAPGGLLTPEQMAQMASHQNPANPAGAVGTSWDAFDKATAADAAPADSGNPIVNFAKGIVEAPATMIARPFQALQSAGESLGANTSQLQADADQSQAITDSLTKLMKQRLAQGQDVSHIQNTLEAVSASTNPAQSEANSQNEYQPSSGGIVAPAPQNAADVEKDVGRGIQTVALGASGAPTAAGAAFGLGSSLEQGNDLFSPATAVQTVLGGIAGKTLDVVGKPIFNAVGKVIAKVTPDLVSDIASRGVSAITDFAKAHEILPEQVSHVINSTNDALAKGESGLYSAIKGKVGSATGAVADKATQMALDSEKAGWEKPTETPKASYNKATDIYNHAQDGGHDIADTLVNGGIRLSDNMESNASGNKVYSTADTADKMRSDAAKMSTDMLRPALEKADLTTVPTPVKDVIATAKANIDGNRLIPQETKDLLKAKIDQTAASLNRQYPDGMKLTDLHDEKIVRDFNSKYNELSDTAKTTEALKNKALADSMRMTLEKNAPADIPVKAFNAELRKQYQAADYLDALHGKTVPRSILSRIAGYGAKIAGAGAGAAVGGGVLGEIGGYQLGGLVEKMIENSPVPLRNMLLANLEKTNPEAFASVEKYLGKSINPRDLVRPVNPIDNSIPKGPVQTKEMGSYKLGKGVTGQVNETGQYRKPGVNFYPKAKK